jgi:hypothetical protein
MRLKQSRPLLPAGREKRPAQAIPTEATRREAQAARRPRKAVGGPPAPKQQER